MLEKIVSGGIQMGMNAFNSWYNNQLASQREAEARASNYAYNEKAADNAVHRSAELYNMISSPEALRKQYLEAGLSPSLMFGGAGPGGETPSGPQGQGASGIAPHTFGVDPVNLAGIELMKAQARKANAEAETEEVTREATLEKIIAETTNTNLKSAGQRFQNQITDIEQQIAAATKDYKIDITFYDYLKADRAFLIMEEELQQEIQTTKITKETADTIIEQEKQKLINLQAQAALMHAQKKLANSNIHLNDEMIKKWSEEIAQGWEQIDIGWNHIYLDDKKLRAQIKQWAFENGITEEENVRKWIDTIYDSIKIVLKAVGK